MFFKNLVVTGATGWLGSELIKEILRNNDFQSSNVVAASSKSGTFILNNKILNHVSFENLEDTYTDSCYFDFAFLTREKLKLTTVERYKEANMKIIQNSVDFIKSRKPKVVVLASSGAVYGPNWLANGMSNDLYGQLKMLQESEIGKACKEAGSKLIIMRIFNLSGSGIKKIETFALAEFIFKSLKNQDIFIRSNYLVTRRYCDVSQLLKLVLCLIHENQNIIFDTGGIKIEIHELANMIVKKLNSLSSVKSLEINSSLTPDNYFSKSNKFEELVQEHLKQAPITLDQQIEITKNALLNQNLI